MSGYLGIDPGLLGGIAYIGPDAPPLAMSMPTIKNGTKTLIDTYTLRGIIVTFGPVELVMLEDVNAGAVKSRMSAFAFGRGYGRIEGLLEALERPHDYVSSPTWTKALGITRGAGKPEHIAVARRLFPGVTIGDNADGPADALLIAEYARRLHSGRSAA